MVAGYGASVKGGPGQGHFEQSRRGANIGGVFRGYWKQILLNAILVEHPLCTRSYAIPLNYQNALVNWEHC